MSHSITTPEPICSDVPPVCPPAPRGRRPAITFDGKHVTIPLFLSGSCSILGTNDSSVIEINDDPALISNRPAADFTLKNRGKDTSEMPTGKVLLQDFPTLPFSFPTQVDQATSSHPASMTMPRSSSDPRKLYFERRRGSITSIEHRRTSFNARCA